MAIRKRRAWYESDDILDDETVLPEADPEGIDETEDELMNTSASELDESAGDAEELSEWDDATADEPITLTDAGDQLSVELCEKFANEAEEDITNFAKEMGDEHGELVGGVVDKTFVSLPGDDGNIDVIPADFDENAVKDFPNTTDDLADAFHLTEEEMNAELDASKLDSEDLDVAEPEEIMTEEDEDEPDFVNEPVEDEEEENEEEIL